MIPINITNKYSMVCYEDYIYNLTAFEECSEIVAKIEFYQTFLKLTDYIPLKIIEGAATNKDYEEILYYRQVAREQINLLNN